MYSNCSTLLEAVLGFPGSCPLIGQFDCGDGTCVDEAKFRDCSVDCPNTNDEGMFLRRLIYYTKENKLQLTSNKLRKLA